MTGWVRWDSQPLDAWAERHAMGKLVYLGGRRTHYLDRGEGEPVVLVHGFNLDGATWCANVEALAERHRVLVPDLWGQGYSTRDPLDYGYPLFAEQLLQFLDVLKLERVALVGHSMGGGTSALFALEHPERVARLVLVDAAGIPAPLPFRARVFSWPGVAELLFALPTDAVRRKNLADYWIHRRELLTPERLADFTRAQKIRGSSRVLISILRRDFFNTLEGTYRELGKLGLPTLVVWGRQDAPVPLASGETIHRLLPGSRLEVLDPAGHLANFDQAERFNQLVLEFLGGSGG